VSRGIAAMDLFVVTLALLALMPILWFFGLRAFMKRVTG
jgi:hypothetical protein